MTPQGSYHAAAISRAHRILFGRFFSDALVRLQLPIFLNESSEPDIALVKFDPTDYKDRHPNASEILLIIEVADSTLSGDLATKNLLYAQAGIEDYWVLNVKNQKLHVLRESNGEGYQSIVVLDKTEAIALLAFPEVFINSSDILSPKKPKP